MICKVCKVPSDFLFTEHMATPIDSLKLTLVRSLSIYTINQVKLMEFYQVSIKLIFHSTRLMRCFDSNCYFQSTKVVKVLVLHNYRSLYNRDGAISHV
jgi:hypothetical protein